MSWTLVWPNCRPITYACDDISSTTVLLIAAIAYCSEGSEISKTQTPGKSLSNCSKIYISTLVGNYKD